MMTKHAQVTYKPTAKDVYDNITASYNGLELATLNRYIADVSADFFVNPETGSDETGTGATMEEAFKTWNKAVSSLSDSKTKVYIKGTITNEERITFKQSTGITVYCTSGSSITKSEDYIMELYNSTATFLNSDGGETVYQNTTDAPMLILNSN